AESLLLPDNPHRLGKAPPRDPRRDPLQRNAPNPSRRCSRREFQDLPRTQAAATPPPLAPLGHASLGHASLPHALPPFDHRFPESRDSPARVRITALQILHLRKYVAQMLAVLAALAMPGVRTIDGPLQGRFVQD